jgi:hypothetical protein
VWAVVFLAAGAMFLAAYLASESSWWAAIPGCALAGLGVTILSGGAPWAGGAFLGALGVGFLAARRADPRRWWAIIPGGALLTLAAIAAIPVAGPAAGGWLFVGLVVTFLAIAALPAASSSGEPARHVWALIPAVGLLGLALVTLLGAGGWAGRAWNSVAAVALILAGAFLARPRRAR